MQRLSLSQIDSTQKLHLRKTIYYLHHLHTYIYYTQQQIQSI